MKRRVNSILICPNCESEMYVPRNLGAMREKKHVKDMYCYKCRMIQKFIEIRKGDFYEKRNGCIVY